MFFAMIRISRIIFCDFYNPAFKDHAYCRCTGKWVGVINLDSIYTALKSYTFLQALAFQKNFTFFYSIIPSPKPFLKWLTL